ncbi:MAG TPA: apolipoprotein N-acyltransferase [Actinomycetota bacterium]|nr:apolipoprotein N-acyltransferase [Actinomycetota bacterium]
MSAPATRTRAPRVARAGAAGVVALAGVALALSYPEADLTPLAWVSVAPLLVVAGRARVAGGAALGALFGAAFFGVLIEWIHHVGWVAWALLVALQASFLAAFGAAWAFVAPRTPSWARPVVAASLWVAVEAARASFPLGGFSWGQLAQSQHDAAWVLRAAAVGGGWAVAWLVVACNALLSEAWARRRAARRALGLAALAALVAAAPAALPHPAAGGARVRVAIVQGNVPRAFAGPLFDKEMAITSSHARLTETVAGRDVDLVVWPESAVGLDPQRVAPARARIESAARAASAPMIVGANLDVDDDRYRVVALHVSPEGRVVDRYVKTHLVPFGEYVPGRDALAWIPMLDQVPRDAVPGDDPTLFRIAGGTVAPVISFEGDFGPLVRDRIARGGRLLVVATNTSTWAESWASAQHVAFSQVRAAENGVWVAHAAISGISAFVRPDGSVASSTGLWTAESLVHDVEFARAPTFYARTGDWLPVASLAVAVVAFVAAARGRVRRKR